MLNIDTYSHACASMAVRSISHRSIASYLLHFFKEKCAFECYFSLSGDYKCKQKGKESDPGHNINLLSV